MTHSEDYRVYYEDTDAGGIVYHANYLRFCERSRTEMLRALGYEGSRIRDEHGLIIVARRLEADYFLKSHLDDILTVKNEILDVRNTSFVMKQSIYRQDVLIFSMNVVLVFIDEVGRPARMPADIKAAFLDYKEKQE